MSDISTFNILPLIAFTQNKVSPTALKSEKAAEAVREGLDFVSGRHITTTKSYNLHGIMNYFLFVFLKMGK